MYIYTNIPMYVSENDNFKFEPHCLKSSNVHTNTFHASFAAILQYTNETIYKQIGTPIKPTTKASVKCNTTFCTCLVAGQSTGQGLSTQLLGTCKLLSHNPHLKPSPTRYLLELL